MFWLTPALAVLDAAGLRRSAGLQAEVLNQIVADLYKKGTIKPEDGKPAYPDLLTFYDAKTPVEQILYVMFLEHRMRAFQGTFHANPDYALWYGWSEMQRDLTEIKEKAAELRETPPTWLPDYAIAEGKPLHVMSLIALTLSLIKELSGEAAIDRTGIAAADPPGKGVRP
mgnify:CR=1 FL=1